MKFLLARPILRPVISCPGAVSNRKLFLHRHTAISFANVAAKSDQRRVENIVCFFLIITKFSTTYWFSENQLIYDNYYPPH